MRTKTKRTRNIWISCKTKRIRKSLINSKLVHAKPVVATLPPVVSLKRQIIMVARPIIIRVVISCLKLRKPMPPCKQHSTLVAPTPNLTVPKIGGLLSLQPRIHLRNLRSLVDLAFSLARCRIRMPIRLPRSPLEIYNKTVLTTMKLK